MCSYVLLSNLSRSISVENGSSRWLRCSIAPILQHFLLFTFFYAQSWPKKLLRRLICHIPLRFDETWHVSNSCDLKRDKTYVKLYETLYLCCNLSFQSFLCDFYMLSVIILFWLCCVPSRYTNPTLKEKRWNDENFPNFFPTKEREKKKVFLSQKFSSCAIKHVGWMLYTSKKYVCTQIA